jgi:hypothetical protein
MLLDRCANIINFGSLYKCQKCQKDDPNDLKHNSFFATCEPKAIDRVVRVNIGGDSPEPSTSAGSSQAKVSKKRVENLQLKDGTAVDPKSKLENVAHVYRRGEVLYNCVLGLTDIQRNKNSYFKLQVLEADNVLGTVGR